MQERDLQIFLYDHPEVLFPASEVTEKSREYFIKGKRIDLFYVVNGIRYIVETKAKPIEREHIGQVIEYYGLMKEYLHETNLKMILVAPVIPRWRRTFLEELGIRCVEIKEIPESIGRTESIIKTASSSFKKESKRESVEKGFGESPTAFTVDDFYSPVSPQKLAKAKFFQRNMLPFAEQTFKEFEITPYRISKSDSDYWYQSYRPEENPTKDFKKSNSVWFAFAFSRIGKAPINNVPNISIWLHSLIFEICVDAEIQTSQHYFIKKIRAAKIQFDEILKRFDDLVFRTYLKFEYQPFYYHWIPCEHTLTKEIDSSFILGNYRGHEESFQRERDFWIRYILENNHTLSSKQATYLKRQNKRLNLAQTLSFPIESTDPLWNQNYETQLERFKSFISRLKPFVEFFVK